MLNLMSLGTAVHMKCWPQYLMSPSSHVLSLYNFSCLSFFLLQYQWPLIEMTLYSPLKGPTSIFSSFSVQTHIIFGITYRAFLNFGLRVADLLNQSNESFKVMSPFSKQQKFASTSIWN